MSTSFPFKNVRIRFAGETDVGKTHDSNEDNLFLPDTIPIGIVADGMGGHASGEVASRICVETVSDYYKKTSGNWSPVWPMHLDPLKQNFFRMESSIKFANAKIHQHSQNDPACHNMGTTVCAIYFEDNYCIIGHVGDSRIYRVRKEGIELLLEDHSFLNDMARMKRISVEEAMAEGTKTNIVSRVLGPNPEVLPDCSIIYPRIGDIFILCSDGLNDMIKDDVIYNICMSTDDLDEMCEKLVDAANEAGGEDNITALAARVEAES
ncbi:protein phosphatase 2C domain-containing protein [Myxococcota bacterium]|nr:protein phosphatase 2C domain-containing protein [Myxococcota bacterium]MBU1496937.1 protein phosphatase 2C domain-containing protein [Myxococcota bacterium]